MSQKDIDDKKSLTTVLDICSQPLIKYSIRIVIVGVLGVGVYKGVKFCWNKYFSQHPKNSNQHKSKKLQKQNINIIKQNSLNQSNNKKNSFKSNYQQIPQKNGKAHDNISNYQQIVQIKSNTNDSKQNYFQILQANRNTDYSKSNYSQIVQKNSNDDVGKSNFQQLIKKGSIPVDSKSNYQQKVQINSNADDGSSNYQQINQLNSYHQKRKNIYLLYDSDIYKQLNNIQRQFLFTSIKEIVKKSIISTQMLFRRTTKFSFDQWFKNVAKKANILMFIKLPNSIIAIFCQDCFDKASPIQPKGDSIILSLTTMKKYNLKQQFKGKAIKYNKQSIILGNEQLILSYTMMLKIMIERSNSYFNYKNDKLIDFIGINQWNFNCCQKVEFHQIFLK